MASFCLLTIIQGKRLFIKDIAHYLVPPDQKPVSIAPSLSRLMDGAGGTEPIANGHSNGSTAPYPYHTAAERNNPTVVPHTILEKFHFTFLIRHPRLSIPSYYRCTIPPLDKVTGFYDFMPSEAGYDELRRVFDYLHSKNEIGPKIAGLESVGTEKESHETMNGDSEHVEICVIDADDLLDNPSDIIEAYCKSVGIDYHPDMLKWGTPEDHQKALAAFEKWPGFHEDVLSSTELRVRLHVSLQHFLFHLPLLVSRGVVGSRLIFIGPLRRRRPKARATKTLNGARDSGSKGRGSSGRPWIRTSVTTSISSSSR